MNIFAPPHPLNTAVLFLVFNRLDTTKQVFEAIRQAKPPRLYIAADGARKSREGEAEKVKAVRDYVMSNIDWKCEFKTLFRDQNLGCKYAVSGAINWFFENEETGIILEDDCLPSQSFFWFCEELLERYKDDMRVFMITGTSYLFNEIESYDDYFFSKYMSIWGWATWKNRWKKYDISMTDYPIIMENNFIDNTFYWDNFICNVFHKYYKSAYENQIDTWDFQWIFRCIVENGFCVTPYKNLVSNLGFEGTRDSTGSPFINMKKEELNNIHDLKYRLPILHNISTDRILFDNIFYRFSKNKKLIQLLIKIKLYDLVKKIRDLMK